MVHDNGPQKATLSPPKKICGLPVWNKRAKSIFKPTANGINPSIVAVAVSITGVIRVRPASSKASRGGMPSASLISANSINRIPFRTTVAARATMPIPVITMTKLILKIPIPSNTPVMLSKISLMIITVRLNELNCVINTRKIKIIDIAIAVPRKPMVSFCSSCSPPIRILTPAGALNWFNSLCTAATTSFGLKSLNTFDERVMIRFSSLRLIPP